jgi:hypothetical protein
MFLTQQIKLIQVAEDRRVAGAAAVSKDHRLAQTGFCIRNSNQLDKFMISKIDRVNIDNKYTP